MRPQPGDVGHRHASRSPARSGRSISTRHRHRAVRERAYPFRRFGIAPSPSTRPIRSPKPTSTWPAGLYDQASELIRKALDRARSRGPAAQLLEILFMWSNKDAFREQAQAFRADLTRGGQWDKIVIMGKQICPGDAHVRRPPACSGDGGVDLDLATSGDGLTPSCVRRRRFRPRSTLDLDSTLSPRRADLHCGRDQCRRTRRISRDCAQGRSGREYEVHDEQLHRGRAHASKRACARAPATSASRSTSARPSRQRMSSGDAYAHREQVQQEVRTTTRFGDFFAFTQALPRRLSPDPTGHARSRSTSKAICCRTRRPRGVQDRAARKTARRSISTSDATGAHLPRLGEGGDGRDDGHAARRAAIRPSCPSFGDTATVQAPDSSIPRRAPCRRRASAARRTRSAAVIATISADSLDFNIGGAAGGERARQHPVRVAFRAGAARG
mgnify:CR=1 FL=1